MTPSLSFLQLILCALVTLSLSACGGGGGGSSEGSGSPSSSGPEKPSPPSPDSGPQPEPEAKADLDAWLRNVIVTQSLTGDPAAARGVVRKTPAEDPKVKLGQLLFFSHTLSADLTVSCASCHMPDFGGSDALSLGVGVSPLDASQVGPARQLDSTTDLDPAADGKPNMHRNSQTVFNAALYDRSLSFDGRVFVIDEATAPGGKGQSIRTPETGNLSDNTDADGLLEIFSKFPLVNHNEMRGYLYSALSQDEYREHLIARLRGEVDTAFLSSEGSTNWLTQFRAAFNEPDASATDIITLVNVQRALAAYISSMTFVETPWKRYVQGDYLAIPNTAKAGAKLFFDTPENGGLGCANCHSGDFFTDEKFHNTGFPQIGRGFMRPEKDDIGRWNSTRQEQDKFAFRTPSLLNIELTMPYGHAGTFNNLEETIRYHSDPRQGLTLFDFTLQTLTQFSIIGSYDFAARNSQIVQNTSSFLMAESMLPNRPLAPDEIEALIDFLGTLTDNCAKDYQCRNQWTPAQSEDPDGNLLVVGINPDAKPNAPAESGADPEEPPTNPAEYPKSVTLSFSEPAKDTFAELADCSPEPNVFATNLELPLFVPRTDPAFGLFDFLGQPLLPHGFLANTWNFESSIINSIYILNAGGVSAAYLNDDCWLDLVYAGGEKSGMVFYQNRGALFTGFDTVTLLNDDPGQFYTGAAFADLNGDYQREMLFGNFMQNKLPIYSKSNHGNYTRVATLLMSRDTYGMAFADTNNDGYLDPFFAHWFPGNTLTAPVFWKNKNGMALEHNDVESGLSGANLAQEWNFSPQFADVNGDGHLDLMIASDFSTSVVMQGSPDGTFFNVTDRSVISDENGMGAALGDYDNDGDLDWFVTSIFDPDGEAEANWGVRGNKLYKNNSSINEIIFEDVSLQAGIADGNWGWGACFADFNNDGFIDIFHVNGYGLIPGDALGNESGQWIVDRYQEYANEYFDSLPRLFINQGDGSFNEEALHWGLVLPSEGRGITCLDYDRDGDIDIALVSHSSGLQFYSNQTGRNTSHHFLGIRLVGSAPNTEAIGSKVEVTADLGPMFGKQTQTRVAMNNSNFNGQNPPDLHFGMGEALTADLRIIWPDNTAWLCAEISTNRFLILDQRELFKDCSIENDFLAM